MDKKNINSFFCKAPFEQVMVMANGDVFFCCDAMWNINAVLGNINKQSFDEIWNSELAQEIRRKALKNEYPYCKLELCKSRVSGDSIVQSFISDNKIDYDIIMKKYPKFVSLAPDFECNINCVTCRKHLFKYSDEEIESLNKKIDSVYLPILKDAEIVMLNSSGEALASRHCKTLINAITQKYPNIKFGLLTNGILCNERNLKQLNIIDKLCTVIVSVNAATKQTYEKFSVGGSYKLVMKNLQFLKSLVRKGKLNCVIVSFVITSLNYKEIPTFIKYAKENCFYLQFIHYVDWGKELNYLPDELAVHKTTHPEFPAYVRIYKKYMLPYLEESKYYIKKVHSK